MQIAFSALFVVLILSSCTHELGHIVETNDYPFLKNLNSEIAVKWRKFNGVDFSVFYGTPEFGEDSEIGIYQGMHPNFPETKSAFYHTDRLGIYNVEWYGFDTPDKCKLEANIAYQKIVLITTRGTIEDFEHIHVWIYSKDSENLPSLVTHLRGLEIFSQRPETRIQNLTVGVTSLDR